MNTPVQPYRSTPIFDETTLPKALQTRHATKAGVWGLVRVIEGRLRLTYLDPQSELDLNSNCSGLLLPEQYHFVTPNGQMKMQIEFYDQRPHGF
jgi:tellurite resistance-related uncharacterized protein